MPEHGRDVTPFSTLPCQAKVAGPLTTAHIAGPHNGTVGRCRVCQHLPCNRYTLPTTLQQSFLSCAIVQLVYTRNKPASRLTPSMLAQLPIESTVQQRLNSGVASRSVSEPPTPGAHQAPVASRRHFCSKRPTIHDAAPREDTARPAATATGLRRHPTFWKEFRPQ